MTDNREAIRGNLGGKYLVTEREGSRDTENAEKNEENLEKEYIWFVWRNRRNCNTCGTGESSGTTPNKQTREDLATHPQDDEGLRFAIALKNIVLSNKSVKTYSSTTCFPMQLERR